MRSCSTCYPHSQPFNSGIPETRSDEKLAFVEHVLGVLIDSRFGNAHPYTRLGERPVATGRSQLFANVTLLTEAEIDAHLNSTHRHFRTSLLCGCLCELCELCVGKRTSHADSAKDAKGTQRSWDVLAISPTPRPPAHAGGSPARGSPTFSGTLFFASSFANLANFA